MARTSTAITVQNNEDKYADAPQYIGFLQGALARHELDKEAILEELGKAYFHCRNAVQTNLVEATISLERASMYSVGMALYLAEARMLCDRRTFSFRQWCLKYGVELFTGYTLSKIGMTKDPDAALREFRAKNRERSYDSLERSGRSRPVAWSDPLARMKITWLNMSREQREVFLEWAAEIE